MNSDTVFCSTVMCASFTFSISMNDNARRYTSRTKHFFNKYLPTYVCVLTMYVLHSSYAIYSNLFGCRLVGWLYQLSMLEVLPRCHTISQCTSMYVPFCVYLQKETIWICPVCIVSLPFTNYGDCVLYYFLATARCYCIITLNSLQRAAETILS